MAGTLPRARKKSMEEVAARYILSSGAWSGTTSASSPWGTPAPAGTIKNRPLVGMSSRV